MNPQAALFLQAKKPSSRTPAEQIMENDLFIALP
jgi:hypothetical protein